MIGNYIIVEKKDGTPVYASETEENWVAVVSRLPVGRYRVKEISVSGKIFNFVEDQVERENAHIRCDSSVRGTLTIGNEETLKGFEQAVHASRETQARRQ